MSKKVKVKRSAEHLSHYLPTEILAAVENSMNEEAGRIAYCERDLKKHLRRYAKGLKLVLPLMIDTKTKQLIEFYGKKSKVKDLDRPPFNAL